MRPTFNFYTSATILHLLICNGWAFTPIYSPTSVLQRASHSKSHIPFRLEASNPMQDMNVSMNRRPINPKPVFLSALEDLNPGQAQMQMATALIIAALAFLPMNADAAMSGGRMGGSFSSSRSSISRPAPTSSYSRGYTGGRSSSYSSGYSSGFSAGYSSRPRTTIITPSVGYGSYYNPITPYYGNVGAVGYRQTSVLDQFIGGLVGTIMLVWLLQTVFQASLNQSSNEIFDTKEAVSSLGTGTSVVQLTVGIEVPDRDDPNSILSTFDRLAKTAKTDSRVGIQNLTSQVAMALLRRRSSITSAYTSYKHYKDQNKARRDFESKSVTERSKFENETVSKYGGVDYSISSSRGKALPEDGKATMAVITMILEIDGDSTRVPKISNLDDVEDALRKIASDAKVDTCLQSAEILWTPEDRSESLSMREVVADYPELRSV